MARPDLLALTADDLAALTNRGTVKRALKELETGQLRCEFSETETGNLIATWSDSVRCVFPAGKTIHDAACSSPSLGISRHVVRSVLAYQQSHSAANAASATPADIANDGHAEADPASRSPTPSNAPWDPGGITDAQLVECFGARLIKKAQQRWQQGTLVELVRGDKPTASFIDEALTVRFLVPDDLRYATGDCAPSGLPLWVTLAVWAFRRLPAERSAGLVSHGEQRLPPPAELANARRLVDDLLSTGLAGLSPTWQGRARRLENSLRADGAVWPADIVAELGQQCELYRSRDGRFDPVECVQLLGELSLRARALRNEACPVPQALVRGSKSDRISEIAGGRLIGVGMSVRTGHLGVTLNSYFQDADTGTLMVLERRFDDPAPAAAPATRPATFQELGRTNLVRGCSLASLGLSQLLVRSGKRSASAVLSLPRQQGSFSVHPQNFQWEHLKPPFAAHGFAELTERLEALPPAFLRPRRRIENLHLVNIATITDVRFDATDQQLKAMLHDASGGRALLVHPFHMRAREGFECLLEALERHALAVRFVCGHVRARAGELVLSPISVVLDHGQQRVGIMPWIGSTALDTSQGRPAWEPTAAMPDSSNPYLDELANAVSEIVVTGLPHDAEGFSELAERGREYGFVRLAEPVAELADALAGRAQMLRWSPDRALRLARQLCVLLRVASEQV